VDGNIGDQPDYGWLLKNRPGSPILPIALDPAHDAGCLDVENGAASPQSAAGWYDRQRKRGVARPCLYADVSNMESEVVPVITAAGIARSSVRLWTAHYGAALGAHICGPKSCGQLSIDADGTQWTDSAMGRNLDQSLLLADFFGALPPAPRYTEFDMSKLPVLKHGDSDKPGEFWSVRRLQSLTALTGSLNGLTAAAGLRVDGSFGAATTAAVKAVQAYYKITQDGIAGAQTWGVLLTGSPA
jgi:peptidoglycan hydrolase-like protein with peptidoglycan-binding domain